MVYALQSLQIGCTRLRYLKSCRWNVPSISAVGVGADAANSLKIVMSVGLPSLIGSDRVVPGRSAIMEPIARGLTASQIAEVAAYLSDLE
jgi:hypothetical protein